MDETNQLPSRYESSEHEQKIYKLWEEAKAFAPKPKQEGEKTFSVLMPPPNANGSLHVGHAVFVTLEDLMTRYHRMKGEAAVWFPGFDHAGFETQVVFEKVLQKQGKSRFEMERDEFYDATLAYTKDNSEFMLNQLKRLGASADWENLKFTLDEDVVDLVYQTFVQLYEDGLAYRAKRPVHWCVKHQTTLSDLEVKDHEQTDSLYYLKYGPMIVATTRPETIFADVAVAVHPEDERFQQYIGQEIEVDFGINKRMIKVVADEMVDREFGTGAVKITPNHDAADFEVAQRHNLPTDLIAINQYGKLTDLAGPLAGLKVDEARQKTIELLEEKGLVEKIDTNYHHSVKTCYKCDRVIEPRMLTQWFIAVNQDGKKTGKNWARDAIQAVADNKTQFVTPRFRKVFDHWMSIIRDWSISRQIVWGIRIPAWYCQCGGTTVKLPSKTKLTFLRHGQAEHNVKQIGNGDPTQSYPLTDQGKEEIKKALTEFKSDNRHFDLIIASEMERTQQSAQIIADGTEIKIDARLNDVKLGGLEGASIAEIHEATSYHEQSAQGSETFTEVTRRVEDLLRDLEANYQNKKEVLIVTSEIIFWALRQVLHPELEPHEMKHHIKNGESYTFSLGDITPCAKCGQMNVERDLDVFDTWFSSGQWPHIVPKTTNRADDFERFYPTSVMETGWDILFFWVARMMMMNIYLTDDVPFKHIYLHGMVRDKDRQKMSKSKGNVMDPLAVIDQYGTDALRLALVFNTSTGNDMSMSEEKVKGMRNFANKLWNVARFTLMNLEGNSFEAIGDSSSLSSLSRMKSDIEDPDKSSSSGRDSSTPLPAGESAQNENKNEHTERSFDSAQDESLKTPQPLNQADKVILDKLNHTIKETTRHFDEFRFHEAAQGLYQFLWSDLADTYLEAAKEPLNGTDDDAKVNTQQILLYVLTKTIKLLHPIMPFVTELIWQSLPSAAKDNKLLINASWPVND
ncbi:class I tRNA ligase family protein [Candidatus Berkelbacteria bacterium]|nr:class I tRNA ligase family protein [Candidatus Berkelbacteria bacterium]